MIYQVVHRKSGNTVGFYTYREHAQQHVDYINSHGGDAYIIEYQQERDKPQEKNISQNCKILY
jgi:hypothetical protein